MEQLKNQQVVIPSPTDKKCKNCIHWRRSYSEDGMSRLGNCTLTRDLRYYFDGTECKNFDTGKSLQYSGVTKC